MQITIALNDTDTDTTQNVFLQLPRQTQESNK